MCCWFLKAFLLVSRNLAARVFRDTVDTVYHGILCECDADASTETDNPNRRNGESSFPIRLISLTTVQTRGAGSIRIFREKKTRSAYIPLQSSPIALTQRAEN